MNIKHELHKVIQYIHAASSSMVRAEIEVGNLTQSLLPDQCIVPDPKKATHPVTGKLLPILQSKRFGRESVFEAAERLLLEEALENCDYIQKEAAELLGITPRVMNYKLGLYGMRPMDNGEQKGVAAKRAKRIQYTRRLTKKKPADNVASLTEIVERRKQGA